MVTNDEKKKSIRVADDTVGPWPLIARFLVVVCILVGVMLLVYSAYQAYRGVPKTTICVNTYTHLVVSCPPTTSGVFPVLNSSVSVRVPTLLVVS